MNPRFHHRRRGSPPVRLRRNSGVEGSAAAAPWGLSPAGRAAPRGFRPTPCCRLRRWSRPALCRRRLSWAPPAAL